MKKGKSRKGRKGRGKEKQEGKGVREGLRKQAKGLPLEVKQLRLHTFIARHAGSIHG